MPEKTMGEKGRREIRSAIVNLTLDLIAAATFLLQHNKTVALIFGGFAVLALINLLQTRSFYKPFLK